MESFRGLRGGDLFTTSKNSDERGEHAPLLNRNDVSTRDGEELIAALKAAREDRYGPSNKVSTVSETQTNAIRTSLMETFNSNQELKTNPHSFNDSNKNNLLSIQSIYSPNKVILFNEETEDKQSFILCRNNVCEKPVFKIEKLLSTIKI